MHKRSCMLRTTRNTGCSIIWFDRASWLVSNQFTSTAHCCETELCKR